MNCPKTRPTGDESEVARGYREIGLDYIESHTRRFPVVVAVRVGRIWQVYKPFQNAQLSEGELRPKWATLAGLWSYWVLLPLAVLGGWLTFRRRITLIPLVAQAVLVTFTAATVYATNRFALPLDVAVVVLAGVGIGGLITRVRRGTFSPAPAASPGDGPPAGESAPAPERRESPAPV
jgi:hypothetical protein